MFEYKNRNKKWWVYLWNNLIENNSQKEITTSIHGRKLHINVGHTYPLFARIFNEYNNPLIETVYQTRKLKGDELAIIDIGAGIGDTIVLIDSNIPNCFRNSFCVEGDTEFFRYLTKNLKSYDQITCINTILSDDENCIVNELVRTHSGSASAQGKEKATAQTLDAILSEYNIHELDLIKIDVDGFDGRVLSGAKGTIQKFKPNIIFEWHPILYCQTHNDFSLPFKVLYELGYNSFLFFSKYGRFSHFMFGNDYEEINKLNVLSLNNRFDYDWHYDIVAIHSSQKIDPIEIAECQFARRITIRY